MIKNKVIVLGGNGFIGRNLCKCFLENGWNVTSFDIAPPETPVSGIKYIEGNFFDDKLLESIIDDKDLIIHSISTVSPTNSAVRYMQGYSADLVQTAKLCSMLINTSKKMIYLSSGGTVYGNQEVQPIKESASTVPINHYGCLKICIENIIRTFNIQNGTNFLIARVANPFGPGQDYKKGVGFVDAAIKKAINNEQIEIWGDGETVRDYIYITDVCKMIYSLASYDGDKTTFNISSGVGISQNQILEILKSLGYNIDVTYKSARPVDAKKIILSNEKIKTFYKDELIPFEEGIKKYCDYLNEIN